MKDITQININNSRSIYCSSEMRQRSFVLGISYVEMTHTLGTAHLRTLVYKHIVNSAKIFPLLLVHI